MRGPFFDLVVGTKARDIVAAELVISMDLVRPLGFEIILDPCHVHDRPHVVTLSWGGG